MRPMKLTDVGIDDVQRYIDDPRWLMQQKFDGTRLVVVWNDGTLFFTNDGVKPIAFAAALLKLPELEADLRAWLALNQIKSATLDGELIVETGIYYVFDAPALSAAGLTIDRNHTLGRRLQLLRSLGSLRNVQFPYTAVTREAKRLLWEQVNERGVEGAVSKLQDSVYVPGTRSKDWVKHKLVKTADVVVTSAERTFKPNGVVSHGKAELAVPIDPKDDPQPFVDSRGKRYASYQDTTKSTRHEPRTMLPVGNASLIGKDLGIGPGSVVEVQYLYFTGEAMVQPRIVRLREDKLAEECDLSQFAAYSRDEIRL